MNFLRVAKKKTLHKTSSILTFWHHNIYRKLPCYFHCTNRKDMSRFTRYSVSCIGKKKKTY